MSELQPTEEAKGGRLQPDAMPVFLPTDELARLRRGRTPVVQASDELRAQLPEVKCSGRLRIRRGAIYI